MAEAFEEVSCSVCSPPLGVLCFSLNLLPGPSFHSATVDCAVPSQGAYGKAEGDRCRGTVWYGWSVAYTRVGTHA